jgi:nicotinic acid mononucleotide adenylyltransferase
MTDLLGKLYARETRLVVAHADGTFSLTPPPKALVLAGSFNPLHEGHRQLLAAGERVSRRRGIFEISIENVDKPDLPREELEQRLAQFRGSYDVAATRTRLFTEKAAALPGAWFVLGFDTAERLLDDRYYADDGKGPGNAERAMEKRAASGTRFVVAGRQGKDGRYHRPEDLKIPEKLRGMFVLILPEEFRVDISSTALRERQRRH